MKTTTSFFRALLLAIVGFLILQLSVGSFSEWAYGKYPILWLVWVVFLIFIVAGEMVVAALQRVFYDSLSEEQKKSYDTREAERKAKQFAGLKRRYAAMLDTKPMETEDEIMLDHNYDGIRELDNNLPPWWKYLFYISIVFAGVYLVYYEILSGPGQYDEYEREVAQAEIQIARYRAENKDLIDVNTVELLTDASDLSEGKALYDMNCAACHRNDGGGGIGPNLTDEYWILGGGIKNVYYTISEGGRSGKGMIPWKDELKPNEIARVASYVLSLQGTGPSDAKEAQGDKWDGGDELIH